MPRLTRHSYDSVRLMGGGRAGVRTRSATAVSLCALLVSACSSKEPKTETYFDRTISPILQSSCVSTNTGANCHITQEHGNALGNLSLAKYSDLIKRRDLLINYGPYGLPNMLLKT